MGVHEPVSTVISTKGQVIVPKSIRDRHGWPPGTRLMVEDLGNGVLLRPAPVFPETSIDEVAGCLHREGKVVSVDEMHEAVAREAKRRARD